MKSKIYDDSLPTLPIYPSTADINYNQTEMSRENGYWYDEIFIVKAGKGILTIDSESYLLEENDMFFIHAGVPHEYHRIGDKFVTSYLSYFGSSTDNILEYYSLGNFGVFKGKNTGAFESKLLRLFEDFDKIQELSILSTTEPAAE